MIMSYSENWPKQFQKEADLIRSCLGNQVISIEHIGSTSIPNLSAKPIIDIAILTNSIQDVIAFVPLLERIGYRYKPDMSSVERIFLRKGYPAEYHVSITESKYSYWTRQMLFRDYLRTHSEAVKEYAEIKARLAGEVPEEELKDLSRSKGYNSGKTPFVEKILGLAQKGGL
jgi:GrpB-like predicted nucleotidyltransferase (UPF0157 family)